MTAVLQYAMSVRRTIKTELPPLLPRADGCPRYIAASGVVWNAPKGSALTVDQIGLISGAQSWAEYFLPETDELCGQQISPLLVLTPLWPSEQYDILQALSVLVDEASRIPGWEIPPGYQRTVTVAIVPGGGSGAGFIPNTMVWLCQMAVPVEHAFDSPSWYNRSALPVITQVSPDSLARCIGLERLPWWPEGCATSVTCSLWSPGAPVPIAMPESLVPRHQAATWLAEQAMSSSDTKQAAELMTLAKTVDISQSERDSYAPVAVPAEYELSVKISWPDAIEARTDLEFMIPLDRVLASQDTPPEIGRTLTNWFGDPRFAYPERMQLSDLPDDWEQAIKNGVIEDTGGMSARRLRLLEHCGGRTGEQVVLDPAKAPAYLLEDELVWLPPTGFSAYTGACTPADVIPPKTQGVLWIRTIGGRVRGWSRTTDGNVSPVPAKSQWCAGENGDVRVLYSALTGMSIRQVFNINSLEDKNMQRLTSLFRTVRTGSPVVLSWKNLLALIEG